MLASSKDHAAVSESRTLEELAFCVFKRGGFGPIRRRRTRVLARVGGAVAIAITAAGAEMVLRGINIHGAGHGLREFAVSE